MVRRFKSNSDTELNREGIAQILRSSIFGEAIVAYNLLYSAGTGA
jgi:hypothetical protein